jgi:hypothetical protein
MDAKTIVTFLESMIGQHDRIVAIDFRGRDSMLGSVAASPLGPGKDPARVAPLLAVTLTGDSTIQVDTSEQTWLFDATDVLCIKTVTIAAMNKMDA